MLYRIVIEAEGEPQGIKEAMAMAAERCGKARVVSVMPTEEYRQMQMGDAEDRPLRHGCAVPPLPEAPEGRAKREARPLRGGLPTLKGLGSKLPSQSASQTDPSGREPRAPAGSGDPWERADRAWDGVMKGLEHG